MSSVKPARPAKSAARRDSALSLASSTSSVREADSPEVSPNHSRVPSDAAASYAVAPASNGRHLNGRLASPNLGLGFAAFQQRTNNDTYYTSSGAAGPSQQHQRRYSTVDREEDEDVTLTHSSSSSSVTSPSSTSDRRARSNGSNIDSPLAGREPSAAGLASTSSDYARTDRSASPATAASDRQMDRKRVSLARMPSSANSEATLASASSASTARDAGRLSRAHTPNGLEGELGRTLVRIKRKEDKEPKDQIGDRRVRLEHNKVHTCADRAVCDQSASGQHRSTPEPSPDLGSSRGAAYQHTNRNLSSESDSARRVPNRSVSPLPPIATQSIHRERHADSPTTSRGDRFESDVEQRRPTTAGGDAFANDWSDKRSSVVSIADREAAKRSPEAPLYTASERYASNAVRPHTSASNYASPRTLKLSSSSMSSSHSNTSSPEELRRERMESTSSLRTERYPTVSPRLGREMQRARAETGEFSGATWSASSLQSPRVPSASTSSTVSSKISPTANFRVSASRATTSSGGSGGSAGRRPPLPDAFRNAVDASPRLDRASRDSQPFPSAESPALAARRRRDGTESPRSIHSEQQIAPWQARARGESMTSQTSGEISPETSQRDYGDAERRRKHSLLSDRSSILSDSPSSVSRDDCMCFHFSYA